MSLLFQSLKNLASPTMSRRKKPAMGENMNVVHINLANSDPLQSSSSPSTTRGRSSSISSNISPQVSAMVDVPLKSTRIPIARASSFSRLPNFGKKKKKEGASSLSSSPLPINTSMPSNIPQMLDPKEEFAFQASKRSSVPEMPSSRSPPTLSKLSTSFNSEIDVETDSGSSRSPTISRLRDYNRPALTPRSSVSDLSDNQAPTRKLSLSELVRKKLTMKKLSVESTSSTYLVNEKGIPIIITDVIDHLMNSKCDAQGIFRVSGNKQEETDVINQYKQAVSPEGVRAHLSSVDSYTNANILKTVLREACEPLLTTSLFSKFLSTTAIEDPEERIQTVTGLINSLPPENKETFVLLFTLLIKIEKNKDKTLMTAENLGTCFGPCLLRPSDNIDKIELLSITQKANKVVEHMVANFEKFNL